MTQMRLNKLLATWLNLISSPTPFAKGQAGIKGSKPHPPLIRQFVSGLSSPPT